MTWHAEYFFDNFGQLVEIEDQEDEKETPEERMVKNTRTYREDSWSRLKREKDPSLSSLWVKLEQVIIDLRDCEM
eukprot:snap_masked-scaffold_35-processed-gene-2.27-mRNA-1 protein AED:1.00 eAED:1.00 QI:0/0/0/0/1/1/2/0/74